MGFSHGCNCANPRVGGYNDAHLRLLIESHIWFVRFFGSGSTSFVTHGSNLASACAPMLSIPELGMVRCAWVPFERRKGHHVCRSFNLVVGMLNTRFRIQWVDPCSLPESRTWRSNSLLSRFYPFVDRIPKSYRTVAPGRWVARDPIDVPPWQRSTPRTLGRLASSTWGPPDRRVADTRLCSVSPFHRILGGDLGTEPRVDRGIPPHPLSIQPWYERKKERTEAIERVVHRPGSQDKCHTVQARDVEGRRNGASCARRRPPCVERGKCRRTWGSGRLQGKLGSRGRRCSLQLPPGKAESNMRRNCREMCSCRSCERACRSWGSNITARWKILSRLVFEPINQDTPQRHSPQDCRWTGKRVTWNSTTCLPPDHSLEKI